VNDLDKGLSCIKVPTCFVGVEENFKCDEEIFSQEKVKEIKKSVKLIDSTIQKGEFKEKSLIRLLIDCRGLKRKEKLIIKCVELCLKKLDPYLEFSSAWILIRVGKEVSLKESIYVAKIIRNFLSFKGFCGLPSLSIEVNNDLKTRDMEIFLLFC